MNLFSNSCVTGVLNDYSVVEKATFTLVKLSSSDPYNHFKASYETIPVQINPSDLVYQFSSPVTSPCSGLNEKTGDTCHDSSYSSASSLAMTLYYDFYDEYQARTAGGAMSFLDSFNLMEEKFSSLQKLVNHANTQDTPLVLFRWGSSISFYGVLERLNPSYRAFSQWGHPLKAEVSVNICEVASKIHDGIKNAAKGDAKKTGMFSKIANTALLASGLALR